MRPHTQTKNVKLFCADALDVLRSLEANSVDLIATDPPYFKVKDEDWDHQWSTATDFLAWLDDVLTECKRVLKPSGSIYLFCSSRLAADTEILMRKHFRVLNQITWAKPNGPWLRQNKAQLRCFFPATERILFAEPYQNDHGQACASLKVSTFSPLIDYFRQAKESLGVTAAEINAETGTKMCAHWFSPSQWQLPSPEYYARLQALFARKASTQQQANPLQQKQHAVLSRHYAELNRTYEALKQEYSTLRRPFSVSKDVPYTDVWTFKPVAYYPGKHPCEKPAELMEHIVRSSSRVGDVVLDPFMGSGSTGKACLKLDRQFIGVDMDQHWCEQLVDRTTH
jgi:adenine-specific DNA-methyltransferase